MQPFSEGQFHPVFEGFEYRPDKVTDQSDNTPEEGSPFTGGGFFQESKGMLMHPEKRMVLPVTMWQGKDIDRETGEPHTSIEAFGEFEDPHRRLDLSSYGVGSQAGPTRVSGAFQPGVDYNDESIRRYHEDPGFKENWTSAFDAAQSDPEYRQPWEEWVDPAQQHAARSQRNSHYVGRFSGDLANPKFSASPVEDRVDEVLQRTGAMAKVWEGHYRGGRERA